MSKGFETFAIKISKEKPKIAKLFKKLSYNPSKKQIILFTKALYGLKQSPKEWQLKLKPLLNKLNFKPLISNSTIFYNPNNGIFIITFIDNYLFIDLNINEINVIKKKIAKEYIIKDRDPTTYFLKVQIIQNRTKRLL